MTLMHLHPLARQVRQALATLGVLGLAVGALPLQAQPIPPGVGTPRQSFSKEEYSKLANDLKAAQAEQARLSQQLAKAREAQQKAEAEAQQLRNRPEGVSPAQLQAAQRERDAAQRRAQEVERESSEAQEQVKKLKNELAQAKRSAAAPSAELADLRRRLEQAQGERDSARAERDQARKALARVPAPSASTSTRPSSPSEPQGQMRERVNSVGHFSNPRPAASSLPQQLI